jgi:signal transduction histidine kinase
MVLLALPATFVYTSFCFVFFGHAFHTFWKKLLLLVLIESLMNSFILYIPGYMQEFNTIILTLALFFIFFRNLSLRDKIRIPLFQLLILIFVEISISAITLIFFTLEELRKPLMIIISYWPIFILFSIMVYRLNKKNIYLGQRIYQFILSNKTILYLAVALILQVVAISALFSSFNNKKSNLSILNFLAVFSIFLAFIIIYLVIHFISRVKSQVFQMTEDMYIEQINNLFTSIKSQRHDFLNNAQVMIALLHRQDKEGLQKYLKDYIYELQDLSEIIVINEPAISALIQTKKMYAEQQNIQFTFKFSDLEKINLGIKIIDIVKILGNLIDNAFDEVMQLPETQRNVDILGWIEAKTMCIKVTNSLKETVSQNQIAQMFQAYYTSKQDGHTGLGLAIIKQKVDQLNGEISATPHEKIITFNLRLPLKNNELKNNAS